jgi:hypothetical protein
MAASVFSVLNAVLLRPLSYKDPSRLASIWSASKNANRDPVSLDDFEDWRRGSKTLASAAVYSSYYQPVLSGGGSAERLTAYSYRTNISRSCRPGPGLAASSFLKKIAKDPTTWWCSPRTIFGATDSTPIPPLWDVPFF